MYAIIQEGGRQYRVEPGSVITIDYRDVTSDQGLELNGVLLLSSGDDTQIGRPLVTGARVLADVVDFPREKTMTQKFRRRKASKRLKGHTQTYVRVKVTHILNSGDPMPQ